MLNDAQVSNVFDKKMHGTSRASRRYHYIYGNPTTNVQGVGTYALGCVYRNQSFNI